MANNCLQRPLNVTHPLNYTVRDATNLVEKGSEQTLAGTALFEMEVFFERQSCGSQLLKKRLFGKVFLPPFFGQ